MQLYIDVNKCNCYIVNNIYKWKFILINLKIVAWTTKIVWIVSSNWAGFSVAFGGTGYSGSAGGRVLFTPLAQTLSASGTNAWGGGGYAPPWKFVKLDSLKFNILRSLDQNNIG